jgi:hypothetical protein
LFRPIADTIFRGALVSVVVVPVLAAGGFTLYSHSSLNTKVDEPLEQPVSFSHIHHVSELGIDCRYCHTSVETSSFAGIPPTKTCMSCHSIVWRDSDAIRPIRESWRTGKPIVWNRVNDLPQFVYFDHSIHIDRGVSCNICHGPIQEMPMTRKAREFPMVWCLDCHRHPEKYLEQTSPGVSPREQVFNLYWKIQAREALLPTERRWARGDNLPTVDESKGQRLVQQEGVRKAELADCEICHR